jgi:nucleoside-diphosphate-sugar epimerase
MKLLITGALGHIGSRLIRSLEGLPLTEVVLLDDLSTQRYCSLFDLPANVPFRFVEGDVLSDSVAALFDGADVVIHLAAITNAAGSFDRQQEVEQVNLVGTERVARHCIRTGAKLLFLSTTSVYGTQESLVAEDCRADELRPQSPYADSKLRAEQLLQRLATDEGLRYVTLRFGTIFGASPGMRFHTAINKFVWQACMGMPITVWRTALDQKRPYLDLEDAIRALRFVIDADRFDNEIYNVLTLNATVREIVDAIERELGRGVEIDFVDSAIMNQLSYEVAREKFERLGFAFQGDLTRSLAETIALLRHAALNRNRPPVAV